MKTKLSFLIFSLILFTNSYTYSQISEEEKSGLLYTLQEEKAAYEFYSEMFAKYNSKVFENIMSAEKTHMDHVLALLGDFNINADSYLKGTGVFSNKELSMLYDDMMKAGGYSLTDALLASARYEEKDVYDLRNLSGKAVNERVKELYDCLDKASQNHLRAFVRNLKKEDINYNPKFLSADEFNEIINSKNTQNDCFQLK